jgi:hypothetical protein
VTSDQRPGDELPRVSPDDPPNDSPMALPDPPEDNPSLLGQDGDTHSGTGVPAYESAYVLDEDSPGDGDGDENAGRGADGSTEARLEQKEQGGP